MSGEGKTMRRRVLHCLPIVVAGVCLCLFLLPVLGTSQDTPVPLPGCWPLQEQGPADTVSLDVAKAVNIPGVVCVRVFNGFSEQILASPQGVRLQKRKEEEKRGHSFQDFEPVLAGARLPAGARLIPAGGVADWGLPYSQKPAAPGIYRACFSYTFPGRKKRFQEVCSQEFSLNQGADIPLLPGCPPLPEQGPAKKISLYVVKALDKSGAVCIRAINELSTEIEYGELAFWLQKWEEERREFQRIEEPDLRGTAVRLVAYGLPAGRVVDRRLPYSRQPAPPGKYRVCFRFRMPGQSVDDEVCSAEFSLP